MRWGVVCGSGSCEAEESERNVARGEATAARFVRRDGGEGEGGEGRAGSARCAQQPGPEREWTHRLKRARSASREDDTRGASRSDDECWLRREGEVRRGASFSGSAKGVLGESSELRAAVCRPEPRAGRGGGGEKKLAQSAGERRPRRRARDAGSELRLFCLARAVCIQSLDPRPASRCGLPHRASPRRRCSAPLQKSLAGDECEDRPSLRPPLAPPPLSAPPLLLASAPHSLPQSLARASSSSSPPLGLPAPLRVRFRSSCGVVHGPLDGLSHAALARCCALCPVSPLLWDSATLR